MSYKLSEKFSVTSCDIQHYSTVICNALMHHFKVTEGEIEAFINIISEESELIECFLPLINLEEDAINSKNLVVLTEILENGSVEVYNNYLIKIYFIRFRRLPTACIWRPMWSVDTCATCSWNDLATILMSWS